MKIYNRHVYPAVIVGLIFCFVTGQYFNIFGAVAVFLIYLLFFALGKMGGGDLKLATALTLFLGPVPVFYGSALAGAGMALWGGIQAWRATGQFSAAVLTLQGKLPGRSVPFAVLLGPVSVLTSILLYLC